MKTTTKQYITLEPAENTGVGRKALPVRIPIRKKGVTIEQVTNFQPNPVSTLTVRNRMAELVQAGVAEVEHVQPKTGQSHPIYRYHLNTKKLQKFVALAS